MNAETGVFERRDLQHLEATLYEQPKGELIARELLSINTAIEPGAETYAYDTLTRLGAAKVIANGDTSLPMVDVDITRQSNEIRTLAAGAQYTRQEIRAAAKANRPIDTLKIATIRRAIAEKENKITFVGDAANGLDGLTNATGIQTSAFTKTMTQMAPGDITNALRDARMKLTTVIGFAGVKPALVLPATQYEYLAGTRFNDYDARTILNVINDYGWFSKILPTDALKGVGENNTDVALLVNTDPSVVEMLLPLDVTMLPQENYAVHQAGC